MALVVVVATFISLVAAGWIFTALDLSLGIGVLPVDTYTAAVSVLRAGTMSKLMTCAGCVVIAGGGGAVSGEAQNASLRASLDRANNVANGQQTTITMLKISSCCPPWQTKRAGAGGTASGTGERREA